MQRLRLAFMLLAFAPAAAASDGFALTLGKGDENGHLEPVEHVRLARLSIIQNRYSSQGHTASRWYSESYLEFDLGYWTWEDRGTQGNGHLWEIGATPVFRLQRGSAAFGAVWPFIEVGVGVRLLSESVISSRDMGTNFHFGSHLGIGFLFGPEQHYDVALRIQHLSNAGIREPNPGVNVYLLRLSRRFH